MTNQTMVQDEAVAEISGMLESLADGFRQSQVLIAAVELGVFEALRTPRSGVDLCRELDLHPAAARDFLDCLVGLELLDRSGDTEVEYVNTTASELYLTRDSAHFIGSDLISRVRRSYRHWDSLVDALRTAEPQNERRDGYHAVPSFDTALCRRVFTFDAIAETLVVSPGTWWSVIDTPDAALSIAIARWHPDSVGTAIVSPGAAESARGHVIAAGLEGRVTVASCDVLTDPLPPTEWCVVAAGLRGYTPVERSTLLRRLRSARPADGTVLVIDDVVDDDRRGSAAALMSALDALIEGAPCLGYTAAEFDQWSRDAGFAGTEITPVTDATSIGVAYLGEPADG